MKKWLNKLLLVIQENKSATAGIIFGTAIIGYFFGNPKVSTFVEKKLSPIKFQRKKNFPFFSITRSSIKNVEPAGLIEEKEVQASLKENSINKSKWDDVRKRNDEDYNRKL